MSIKSQSLGKERIGQKNNQITVVDIHLHHCSVLPVWIMLYLLATSASVMWINVNVKLHNVHIQLVSLWKSCQEEDQSAPNSLAAWSKAWGYYADTSYTVSPKVPTVFTEQETSG